MLNPVRRTTFSNTSLGDPSKSPLLVVPYYYSFKYWCATDFSPLEFLPFNLYYVLLSYPVSGLRKILVTGPPNLSPTKFSCPNSRLLHPVAYPTCQLECQRVLRVTFIDWAPWRSTAQAYSSHSLPIPTMATSLFSFLKWKTLQSTMTFLLLYS